MTRRRRITQADYRAGGRGLERDMTEDDKRFKQCPCGSGEPREAYHDGYGLFLFFGCAKCYDRKRSEFRPDIMERYKADEPIEPED